MNPTFDTNRDHFCSAYREQFGFQLLYTDADGSILSGTAPQLPCSCGGQSNARRRLAMEQTAYWGEAIINLCCENGYAMWAVPVMHNDAVTGAWVVQGVELEGSDAKDPEQVENAARGLLKMALAANHLAKSRIDVARQRALAERDRFDAIQSTKRELTTDDLRSIYLQEEGDLLGAIKQGELNEARSILNRVLTGIYGLSGDRMELLKSCLLELVVMMSRAAVEAGADPSAVLGRNYQSLVELAGIEEEEALSAWVRRMLDLLMEQIRNNTSYPHSLLLLRATRYMRAHLHEHISRDEVARVAGVSPSHFSKLMTERMGRSFSQLLTQLRVQRARELLARTDRSLTEIAIECGFCDQSHLTKVFRAHAGMSPGRWRRENA